MKKDTNEQQHSFSISSLSSEDENPLQTQTSIIDVTDDDELDPRLEADIIPLIETPSVEQRPLPGETETVWPPKRKPRVAVELMSDECVDVPDEINIPEPIIYEPPSRKASTSLFSKGMSP